MKNEKLTLITRVIGLPKEIIEQKTISNAEALEVFIEKIGGEPESPIQRRTLEYLRVSSKCPADIAREVVEELVKLDIPREAAIVLVNILPEEPAEARALLPPIAQALPTEKLEKAIELLAKCRKE